MRWGMAAAGAALFGAAVVLAGGWAPWSWLDHEHRGQIDASVVRLDVGSGSVTVRRGPVDRIALATRSWSWRDPGTSWTRDGDALQLNGCGWGCSIDYDLVVPAGTRVEGKSGSGSVHVQGASAVDVEVGSGSIDVRDVAGAVHASTSSGSVVLDRVTGPATAHSSSGSVSGTELAGPVDATTSSGSVRVDLTRPQSVRAETSSGDVSVAVPPGRYRISINSSHSAADRYPAGVVADSSARYSVDLRTSSGAAAVRAR
jgi:Toastrack DUF4097